MCGLVGALLAAALVVPPVWAWADPRLPVSESYHGGADEDPWGSRWALATADEALGHGWVPSLTEGWCSPGPNRRAEGGRGDDVRLLEESDLRLAAYRSLGEGLFALAVLLGVAWELGRAFRRHLRAPWGPSPVLEAVRVLALAGFVGVPAAVVWWLSAAGIPAGLMRPLEERLVVPPGVAVVGSAYLLTAAVLGGFRLRTASPSAAD